MQKVICRLTAVFLTLFSLASTAASELQSYVQQCQNELHFNAGDVPALNCNDGVRFAGGAVGGGAPLINDYVLYKRINDTVDLAVACRWLIGHSNDPSAIAASVELLIHNRENGSTCFFSAQDSGSNAKFPVSTAIVSPTDFHNKSSNPLPNADDYWASPTVLNSKQLPSDQNISPHPSDFPNVGSFTEPLRCIGCHVEGPYIASPDIVPYLARFGLLNNGHDTHADMTAASHYHAVGSSAYNNPSDPTNTSAFKAWDSIIYSNMIKLDPITNQPIVPCSIACHSLGHGSTVGSLFTVVGGGDRLLPSLSLDIALVAGIMPPYDEASDYHWINRDTPGDGVDIETFTASQNSFPVLPYYCGVPTVLEAHAVGSSANFSTTDMAKLPDKLSIFNTREGLVCLNADQPNGRQCNNYSIKYLCSDGSWSGVYDMDSPTFGGDHEERYNDANVCTSKPGLTAVAIQATTTVNGATIIVNGPNDRLAEFIPTGLICKNSDQPNGQSCSNYVVRYRSCTPKSQASIAKIKNVWTAATFTNRFLTTTNNVNGAETRAQGENAQYPSQDWIIEIVSGSTVRLKDVWSGKYLTASSTNDLATVMVNDSNPSLTRQQWVIETIANSTEVRLRNVGTNRYLTVGNYTTDPYYAPIVSQALSNQNWTSQRWVIQ